MHVFNFSVAPYENGGAYTHEQTPHIYIYIQTLVSRSYIYIYIYINIYSVFVFLLPIHSLRG